MKIILYVRKLKLQKPDDLYEGMPVYQCWPRSANMDNSNAESWASGSSWRAHYECVKVEVENQFDIILAGGVSFRGQSAKVPVGLIWCEELQAYLSFDFRVDYLMAALDVCDVRQRVIDRKMSFIYKGSNYYPVPYGSQEYLAYEKAQEAKAKGIRPKYTKSYSPGDVILSQGENLIYLGDVSVVVMTHKASNYNRFFGSMRGSTRPFIRHTTRSKSHVYYHESGYIGFYDTKKSTTLVNKPTPDQEKEYKKLEAVVNLTNRAKEITSDVECLRHNMSNTYLSLKDKVAVYAPNYTTSSHPSHLNDTKVELESVNLLCDQHGYVRTVYDSIDLKGGVLRFSGGALEAPFEIDTRNIK